MKKTADQLADDLNQARIVNLSAGVLYPILNKHEEEKVAQMCAKFTSGETNFVADVASLSYIRELKRTLEVKQKHGERAAKILSKEK